VLEVNFQWSYFTTERCGKGEIRSFELVQILQLSLTGKIE